MTNHDEDGLLELADVLARLGQEMKRAAEVDDPTIAWFNAEVELESVVERSADGGVSFWVASAGGRLGGRNTVKVRVSLAPFDGELMPAGM